MSNLQMPEPSYHTFTAGGENYITTVAPPTPTVGFTPLYTAEALRDVLEMAAGVCDAKAEKVNSRWIPDDCARAIRALIKEVK